MHGSCPTRRLEPPQCCARAVLHYPCTPPLTPDPLPPSPSPGLNNFLAWRNANMPGKPVWVTEWGWDARLPSEPCAMSECVTQYAKAVYAVRGLMVLARKGVDLCHW